SFLSFNLQDRILLVYHTGDVKTINKSIAELNLNSILVSTEVVEEVHHSKSTDHKILWMVLIINFTFFLIEIIFGLISESMGLVADSLDMLADSFVYGMSLMVVSSSLLMKKRVAKISGYLQLTLAIIGFTEVLRRFLGFDVPPEFHTMIIVSVFALLGNALSLFILQKSKNDEAHIRASKIFTSNDVIINLGVIAAGILVNYFQSNKPDLIIGTVVFLIVISGALRILKLSK
ncbi:MAG TPA: cation transporter, partial [Ignavibacteriaceae bacterium]|nr:cation transporter [Ignavibacteriaceae bacterium]